MCIAVADLEFQKSRSKEIWVKSCGAVQPEPWYAEAEEYSLNYMATLIIYE